MGDMADDFRFMKEHAKKERAAKEPDRIEYAVTKLSELGIKADVYVSQITFMYKDSMITLYPYKGWWTGKNVGSGRGIDNLLERLKT